MLSLDFLLSLSARMPFSIAGSAIIRALSAMTTTKPMKNYFSYGFVWDDYDEQVHVKNKHRCEVGMNALPVCHKLTKMAAIISNPKLPTRK